MSHGSTSADANQQVASIADAVRAEAPDYLIVEHAFMQFAAPTIADGIARCVERGATDIVVHPFMLSPGTHARDDVPAMAREAAAAHRDVTVRVSQPLGPDPRLAPIILERCGW